MGQLDGKVCVVTGATTGIGKEIARNLAREGASVILPCRTPARGAAAKSVIPRAIPTARVTVAAAELSSQASIRAFAGSILAVHSKLDVLVNNAGVWSTERTLSPDGIELTWATNVLGYHLLTSLLRPALEAASGRIVNVASTLAKGLDMNDVQFTTRRYDGMAAYAQSKQANRMLTWVLAEKLAGKVTANAVHPGFVASELNRQERGLKGLAIKIGHLLIARSTVKGAEGATWLATSPEAKGVTGKFYMDRKELECRRRDPEKLRALWELVESQTGKTWS